jgi:hypothetical protein
MLGQIKKAQNPKQINVIIMGFLANIKTKNIRQPPCFEFCALLPANRLKFRYFPLHYSKKSDKNQAITLIKL